MIRFDSFVSISSFEFTFPGAYNCRSAIDFAKIYLLIYKIHEVKEIHCVIHERKLLKRDGFGERYGSNDSKLPFTINLN